MEEKEELNFEEALSKLEEINNKLERNSVPLEKAIELYSEGMELIKFCKERLDEAEGKIKKITDEKEEIIKDF
ncbi:MAG: exodeoxyribonuclease VII small subunit [Thermoplasmatota archaeon]